MDTAELIGQAEAALSDGNSTLAYDLAVSVTLQKPEVPKSHELAARAAGIDRLWPVAADHWKRLTVLQPNRIGAYAKGIRAYQMSKNIDAALELVGVGIHCNPDTLDFEVKQLELLRLQEKNEQSKKVQAALVQKFNSRSDPTAAINFSRLLSQDGQHETAIAILEQLDVASETVIGTAVGIALARRLYTAGYHEKSRLLWLEFLDQVGVYNQYEVSIYLARIASHQKCAESLVKYALIADKHNAARTEPLQLLVKQALSVVDYESCLMYSLDGQRRFSEVEFFALNVALSYSKLGELDKADSSYRKALDMWPSSKPVVSAYGQFLQLFKSEESVCEFWRNRLSLFPDSTLYILEFARYLKKSEKWEELAELLNARSPVFDPSSGKTAEECFMLLSGSLIKTKKFSEARDTLDMASSRYPGNVQFWIRMIQLLVEADEALNVVQKVEQARSYFTSGNAADFLDQAKIYVAAEDSTSAKMIANKVAGCDLVFSSDADEKKPSISDTFCAEDRYKACLFLSRLLMREGVYGDAKVVLQSMIDMALTVEQNIVDQGTEFVQRSLASIAVIECMGEFTSAVSLQRKMPESLLESIFRKCFRVQPEGEFRTAMIISSSLRPGGAERQFVATIQGLAAIDHGFDKVSALALTLDSGTQADFFRGDLEDSGQMIREIGECVGAATIRDLVNRNQESYEDIRLLESLTPELAKRCVSLYTLFKLEKPAVVQSWQDSTNIICALAAILAGVPRIVLTTCSTRPDARRRYRTYLHPAYLELAKRSDVVIINNSDAGAKDYENWLELPRGTVRTVYNGIDTDLLRESGTLMTATSVRESLGFERGCKLVGGVMRFSEEKRPDLWLDVALEILRLDSECRFVLIGDGPMRVGLCKKIASLGLEKVVSIPGTRRPVEPWMAAMDVMFLSSSREGLPNVLIEAQTLGVPVVSTNVGGTGEAFVDGTSGLLVDSSDPVFIASQIHKILCDDEWRRLANAVARKNTDEKFGIEVLAHNTLDCFEEQDM